MERKDVLLALDVGSRVAEEEQQKLKNYFLQTQQYRELEQDRVDIVYGAKGTGKSAMYIHMVENSTEFLKSGIAIIQAENVRGESAFKSVVNDPPTDEQTFRNLWKLYFLVLIYNHIRRSFVFNRKFLRIQDALRRSGLSAERTSLIDYFSDAYHYIKRSRIQSIEGGASVDSAAPTVTGFTGKITFDETVASRVGVNEYNIKTLLDLANDCLVKLKTTVWLSIDRLDTVFEENEVLEENAIRGLFKAYLDSRSFSNVRIKLFLRTDIWGRITKKGFRESSHITRSTTVTWTDETILNMLVKRFVENPAILEHYSIKRDRVLSDFEFQNHLFYRVFPERIEKGDNKSETLRWIISHTSDGTNTITPREIIHLILELKRIQITKIEIGRDLTQGENLFDRLIFKEALAEVSRTRMEQTVFTEYSALKPAILKLQKKKATNTFSGLVQLMEIPAGDAKPLIEQLCEIGILRKVKFKTDDYYEVPFIYRPFLGSVQGRGSAE